MTITLPYPPTINHYYVRTHFGGQAVGKRGRQYRLAVAEIVQQERLEPVLGRMAVMIAVHPPDNRKRDLDNVLKAALDALQAAGVYADDCAIDCIHVSRGQIKPGGELFVQVTECAR